MGFAVAATRPIPGGLTTDLELSEGDRYLWASYPGLKLDSTEQGALLGFNVEEILKAVENPGNFFLDSKQRGFGSYAFDASTQRPATVADLGSVPIDDINPDISTAADYQIIGGDWWVNFDFGVPDGSQKAPIAIGGTPNGLALSSAGANFVELVGPGGDETELNPTFQWQLQSNNDDPDSICHIDAPSSSDIESVKLFVSTFSSGQGLLPGDDWEGSKSSKEGDRNPNRILTATWNDGVWTWNGGSIAGSNTRFTLPDDRMLTAGQEYHWAVEVTTKNGSSQTVTEEFQTSLPEPATDNPFTSVTVLTPGIKVQNHESINVNLWATARQIQDRGGEVLRYQPITSQWQSVTYNPSVRDWVVNENQQQPVVGKPLVLLADWINGIEPAKLFNSGFAEAAADAMFASLVQLDQKYDGTVGGVNGLYDQNGNLIRQQGDIFNSPLHFIGIGQGAVVNTEMIQRLGTYFPNAGGTSDGLPDIQMTTVDPHDYDENSPSIFQNIFDPEIVVWDNVTYADNYYQTNGTGNTLNGQELSSADWNVNLGSLVGFDQNLDKGGPHQTAAAWYAGTADLSPSQIPDENGQTIYRRLGDLAEGETPWYVPDRSNANLSNFGNESAPWEGIGTGWFNSVLGGGDELRPNNNPSSERLSVKEDNNSIPTMRGDYAVPTLFNGNFDSVTAKLSNQYIPGWSFSEGSLSPSSQTNLVEWRQIASLAEHRQKIGYNPTKSNYSLKLTSNQSITHDPFVVPDWGVLRLDLHLSESDLNKSGKLKVYLEEVGSADNITIQEISLEEAEPQKNDKSTRTSLRNRDPVNEVRQTYTFDIPSSYEYDKNTIGYGSSGFETFHFDIDPSLRGKVATLKLELLGSDETVYVDNVFFKSEVLKWGNPTEARNDPNFGNNFLIEKPQYSLSYNQEKNTINWVGWKLDKTWLGTVSRPPKLGFAEDPDWKKTGWYSVKDADYDALYLKTHDGQTKDNREGIDLGNGQVYPDIDARTGNYIPILEIDRGHMAPAAHRSRTAKDLYATFLTTNLIPQESSNNRGIWKQQEDLVRDVIINADKSEQLETYMFAGGFGYYDNPGQRPYTGISQNPELDPTIQFPLALWKVVLTKDKQSELPEYSHYGFYLGNAPRTVVQKQSIQNLETLLNGDLGELSPEYQFLSNVPESSEKEKIKRTIFERLP